MNDLVHIAMAYAPSRRREALLTLWKLDQMLGRIITTTTNPLIGQLRLTWWHERLAGLDDGEVVTEPLIAALNDIVQNCGIAGAMLSSLIEGWELLLEPMPFNDALLREFAAKRGNGLFDLSARIMGSAVSAGMGANWALIDFAMHCSDRTERARALAMYATVPIHGPKPLRILAQIAKIKSSQSADQIVMPVGRWTVLRSVLR